jgi:transcriptional regulator with XRE-family HTH domain
MNIGERLKKWRANKRFTQKDAGELLGMSSGVYQKYEMGLRAPGAEAMEAFVKAGINANWLLTGEESMWRGQVAKAEPREPTTSPLDVTRMQLAITTIEEVLSENGRTMPPAAKARAIGLAYQILEDEDKEKDRASFNNAQKILTRLIKTIA